VVASEDFNTITTGDGIQSIVALGSRNTITIGNTTTVSGGGPGGSCDAGGTDTIDNFNAADHLDLQSILGGLDLTPTLEGLAGNITVTEQTDTQFRPAGVDTLVTVIGAGGTAPIALHSYDAGGLAGLLNQNSLVLPT
jgi:hypothetical protein